MSLRDLRYWHAPAPGDAVHLPFLDGVAALPLLALVLALPKELRRQLRGTAELINENGMIDHLPIVGTMFLQVKGKSSESCADDCRILIPHSDQMPSKVLKDEAISAGSRLRQTRLALGINTMRRFAELLHEDESLIRKYENGIAMVPNRVVDKLKKTYKVDHNWIYGGDMDKLPYDLVLKLIGDE